MFICLGYTDCHEKAKNCFDVDILHQIFAELQVEQRCWKARHSKAVSRLNNVLLKCVQVCNWGWIRVPEPESRRDSPDSTAGALIPFSRAKVIFLGWRKSSAMIGWLGMRVQTRRGGVVGKAVWDKAKNMPEWRCAKQTYTAWKHTRGFLY